MHPGAYLVRKKSLSDMPYKAPSTVSGNNVCIPIQLAPCRHDGME